MNNEILTIYDLKGYWIGYGSGYGDGTGSCDGTGYGYGDENVYRYFYNLTIKIDINFPTRVLNYYKETIDNYE